MIENGLDPDLVIVSDDAGQFNILLHALCRIHTERSVDKLVGFSEDQQQALENKRSEIWVFMLKDYKKSPCEEKKEELERRFDEIFKGDTCFASLNQLLKRIHNNKSELLLVPDRPDIPLHNNLSENDIREYVKKRKISGSARSEEGKRCRDTFASLKKTCRKLGISFWEFLKDRITGKAEIPFLSELVRQKAAESVP
ncbi:MAG: transposase [bacterium]|nr:transposase [bacterium]